MRDVSSWFGQNLMPGLLLIILSLSALAAAEESSLTILYTSDLSAQYSAVELEDQYKAGWGRLAGLIDEIRAEDSPLLLLDVGDYLDEKQMMCQVEDARRVMQMLNEFRYDAMGIGMDELNWGSTGAFDRLRHANFPVVCTNLVFAETGELLFWPYWVVQLGEVRVAVLGTLDPKTRNEVVGVHLQDVKLLDPAESIRAYIARLRSLVDLFVLLSYMDHEANRALAQEVPELNLIIGGYDHQTPKDPSVEGQTILAQAGSGANWLGRFDLKVVGSRVIHWEHHSLGVTPQTPVKRSVERLVEEADVAEQVLRAEILARLDRPLEKAPGESLLGNWIADAMRLVVDADVAFQNSRGIRKSLKEGFVTRGDLFDLNYYNTILTFELTGDQIRQIAERNAPDAGDFLLVSGLSYTYRPKALKSKRIAGLRVGSEYLEPNRVYRVATNHFVGALAERYFGFPLPHYEDTFITLYESQVEALRRDSGFAISEQPRVRIEAAQSSR